MAHDDLREARAAYARGDNIMRLFRDRDAEARNSTDAVLVSYDLQSGSYRRLLADPKIREKVERYTDGIAGVLGELDFDSMLDVGTGEATTLLPVLSKLPKRPERVAGFDLAWSRVAHARAHARGFDGGTPQLFTGDLFAMPVLDGGFDLVMTAHALEPNGGREREALSELARVSCRWIALFEPTYELGSEDSRARILEHGYVRGLPDVARELGLTIVRHELLSHPINPVNQTQVLVLHKDAPAAASERWLGCARCGQELLELKGHLFCAAEGLVYPIIDGIACLSGYDAVVASAFADDL